MKYSQKLLDHPKQSATDALKTTSKRVIQKTAEATGDLISSEIADRITKVSKTLPQNNSETITNEHDKEIPNNTRNLPSRFGTKYRVDTTFYACDSDFLKLILRLEHDSILGTE